MEYVINPRIVEITETGICFRQSNKDKSYNVSFSECAKNFCNENGKRSRTCVAHRDITSFSYVFFSSPKLVVSFKRKRLNTPFSRWRAWKRFHKVRNAIADAGYSTYDMS